ncbi:MAG: hypothetical protein JKY53_14695 [Flavobacteriales bacterium]|nr:hypothetical protein [Flavobacteriales bacterium]
MITESDEFSKKLNTIVVEYEDTKNVRRYHVVSRHKNRMWHFYIPLSLQLVNDKGFDLIKYLLDAKAIRLKNLLKNDKQKSKT